MKIKERKREAFGFKNFFKTLVSNSDEADIDVETDKEVKQIEAEQNNSYIESLEGRMNFTQKLGSSKKATEKINLKANPTKQIEKNITDKEASEEKERE